MRVYYFLLILILCPVFISGQNYSHSDSLKDKLAGGSDKDKIDILNSLVLEYKNIDIDSSLIFASRSYSLLQRTDYSKGEADYLYVMGMVLKQRSNFTESLEYFQNSLSKYKDIDDIQGICDSYTGIGDIYEYQQNDSLALSYYNSALSLAKDYNLQSTIAQNYNNLGAIIKSSDTDKAVEYFNNAIDLYTQLDDKAAISSCYNNLGILYSDLGEFHKTEEYFLKSYNIKIETNNFHGQAITLNNLAYLSLLMSENTSDNVLKSEYLNNAIDYAKKSLEISESTQSLYTIRNSYGTLTEAYYDLGMLVEAMDYQSLFMQVKDSLFDIENQKNLIELETKYKVNEQNLEIEQLESENKLNRAKNFIYFLSGFGILILSMFVLVVLLIRRKKDRTIFEQKEMLHLKEKKLAKIELERKTKKEAELINELDYKSKQLNTHALNMVQRNQLLSEISNELELIDVTDSKKSKKQLQNLRNKLNLNQNNEKDWEKFKMYFEQINKDFYDNLNLVNSELSVNDKRICALIKLNLRSSEIAQVLNIAPNSIKSARYRLKKRLGLGQDDDLELFVRNL